VTTRRVRAARLDDVPPGRPLRVEAAGAPVLIVRAGDAVYACGAVCAHQGGPLEDGKLSGTRLACPWHGWMYDVRTGDCVFPGRGARVPTFPTAIDGGDVWVELPSEGGVAC
jgi:nitrite reductase (NADH) small subunit/3-phenylpropionate/trans-cinnamate dioxygenase ferredoxin subunit